MTKGVSVYLRGKSTKDVFDGELFISLPYETASDDTTVTVKVRSPWGTSDEAILGVGDTVEHQNESGIRYSVLLEKLGGSFEDSTFRVFKRQSFGSQAIPLSVDFGENNIPFEKGEIDKLSSQLKDLKKDLIESFANEHKRHAEIIDKQIELIIDNLSHQGKEAWKHTAFTSLLSAYLSIDIPPSDQAMFWSLIKHKLGEVTLALPFAG